jgi:methylase of polypeptide subunit release factors
MTIRTTRFGSADVTYDDGVLEPRPWTIQQSRWAIELLGEVPDGPVLELCAGVGHIGLVVAVEAGGELVQVDVDPRACELARANAERAGVTSDVRCGELDEALGTDECFPLVLADPPYVPSHEVADLPDDPAGAIDGGEDGLDIARTCLAVAAGHLAAGGRLVLQLASTEQAAQLRPAALDHQLEVVEVRAVDGGGALVLLRPART